MPMFVDNCGPVVFVNFILTEYLEVPVVLVTGLEATVTVLALLIPMLCEMLWTFLPNVIIIHYLQVFNRL